MRNKNNALVKPTKAINKSVNTKNIKKYVQLHYNIFLELEQERNAKCQKLLLTEVKILTIYLILP